MSMDEYLQMLLDNEEPMNDQLIPLDRPGVLQEAGRETNRFAKYLGGSGVNVRGHEKRIGIKSAPSNDPIRNYRAAWYAKSKDDRIKKKRKDELERQRRRREQLRKAARLKKTMDRRDRTGSYGRGA